MALKFSIRTRMVPSLAGKLKPSKVHHCHYICATEFIDLMCVQVCTVVSVGVCCVSLCDV